MTRVYYKEALGAIVVYDVTRPQTFEGVTKWKNDIDTKVALPDAWGGGQIPVILLANKVILFTPPCTTRWLIFASQSDLIQEGHGQHVNPTELDQFCQDNGFIKWYVILHDLYFFFSLLNHTTNLGLKRQQRIIPTLRKLHAI